MPQTGEEAQESGREGVRSAKRWLESTCRAEVKWDNPTKGRDKLQYRKAAAVEGSENAGDYFSFDCGGTLLGGDNDGDTFLAEVKHYSRAGDQGVQYREFLAKCYRTKQVAAAWCNHFVWITWAPFLVSSWPQLRTAQYVQEALTANELSRAIALGTAEPDPDLCATVASHLMIVVVCDLQLRLLSLQDPELLHVRKALLEIRG